MKSIIEFLMTYWVWATYAVITASIVGAAIARGLGKTKVAEYLEELGDTRGMADHNSTFNKWIK